MEKKEKQLKKPTKIYLTFFIFKDGRVTYNIGTTKANKDYTTSFTVEEILACKDPAIKDGLAFDLWYDPKDNPIQAITFIKTV